MSLASRLTGNNAGQAISSKHNNAASNVHANNLVSTNQSSNQANAHSSGALLSLLHSGLSLPREMTVQARGAQDNQHVSINLSFTGTIGQGTFGQIERAILTLPPANAEKSNSKNDNGQNQLQVAVKRVLQDPRYKNRELSIMQQLNNHPNVVKFYYYYYSTASSNSRTHRSNSGRTSGSVGVDVFLHLVLECFPESLCELIYRYSQRNLKIPVYTIKLFTYQMLKALSYLHKHQICHRDIKSSNLLVNETTGVLKVCDFGSAKEMVPGTVNVSYISSRYYRAPELLFGAHFYTCAIDTWSGGCVLAEMLRHHCLFMGADSVDQLVKVIRVLGTPTSQDISSMNPMYGSYNFPDVQSCPVKLFFPQHTPADLLALMSKMLVYNPSLRILPSLALGEPCFDELREIGSNGVLPNRVPIPSGLFDNDPEPVALVVSPEGNNPSGGSNYWASTNKKFGNTGEDSGVLDKKVSKYSGSSRAGSDWQRKGQGSGDKCASSVNQTAEVGGSNGAHENENFEKHGWTSSRNDTGPSDGSTMFYADNDADGSSSLSNQHYKSCGTSGALHLNMFDQPLGN